MIKNIFSLVVLLLMIGCGSSDINKQKKFLERTRESYSYEKEQSNYIKNLMESTNVDSMRANTTDFYHIKLVARPQKESFEPIEQKKFSLHITNFGTKELSIPQGLKRGSEIIIDVYKKKNKRFKKYDNKNSQRNIFIQEPLNQSRAILTSQKGQTVTLDDILIEFPKAINETGIYMAKISIDLSNFGYFKILETEMIFKVQS